jgi:hypothetical protein
VSCDDVLACVGIRFSFFETTSVTKDSITPLLLFIEARQTALLRDFQAHTCIEITQRSMDLY